jgi:F-type H+-transporting ATPase subunit gamma
MASLRDIRKRIKSVKNSQKITKAMKMVSAAKLRRAEQRVKAARPYAEKLARTCAGLAKRAEAMGEAPHPLLTARPEAKKGGTVEILTITSDRGLCGAFNSNVVRRSLRQRFDLKDAAKQIRVSTIGKKGTEGMKREKVALRKHYEKVVDAPSYEKAQTIALELTDAYEKGEIDSLYLVYNEFVNASTQRVVWWTRSSRSSPSRSPPVKSSPITSTSPAATRCSARCCRASSRRASTAPSSRASPPSTRRACPPWTTRRRTPRRWSTR